MTFKEFLEGRETWNSKNPEYDISLASDASQEENNSTVFLLPFAKKMKSFGYYCNVISNSIDQTRTYSNAFHSRNQKTSYHKSFNRTAALSNLFGVSNGSNLEGIEYFESMLATLVSSFETIHNNIRYSTNIEFTIEELEYIISVLKSLINCNVDSHKERFNEIKERLKRMLKFCELSLPQLENLPKTDQKLTKLVPYRGRF